ncbi:hypothetical protein PBY51_006043 [Eleginops maclovinus]|uniref:Uncharacterized protein n=1 Tax=Eleginops maclovinus TaxID=56733 RepID=A0AAN8A0U4_ELEMC|nr:hypothetical protein PBY51_006043 [Eleginops maclovinus]
MCATSRCWRNLLADGGLFVMRRDECGPKPRQWGGDSEEFSPFVALVRGSNRTLLFQTGGVKGGFLFRGESARTQHRAACWHLHDPTQEPQFLFSFLRRHPQDEACGRSQERGCSMTFTPSTSSS